MNHCVFSGNLANEVDLRTTTSGKSVAQFRLAVQRRVPNAQGEREADFLTIIMWGKTAESAARWLHKGTRVNIEAECRTRTYDAQDGSKRHVVEFVANNWEFAGAKQQSDDAAQHGAQTNTQSRQDDFVEVDDDELPF